MKLLTRSEEMLLLAVWRLQDEAFGNSIREQLMDVTDRDWAFGALFVSLDRLCRKGMLDSNMSPPRDGSAGRRRRYYHLTGKGRRALLDIRRVERSLWNGLSEAALEAGR